MVIEKELEIYGVFSFFQDNRLNNIAMKSITDFSIAIDGGQAIRLIIFQDTTESHYVIESTEDIKRFIDEYGSYKKNLSMGNISD